MYMSGVSSTESKKSDSTDDSNNAYSNLSYFNKNKTKIKFPTRLSKIENNSSCGSCQSDSSVSDGKIINTRKRNKRRSARFLPPLGVFWDIENCQVPKYKSAASVVQRIREQFLINYRETEFLVVCDVKKENAQILQDLHDAQVNLIHVSSTSKNAADEKLRQSLRRFAEIYTAPSAVVLISGDINFAADLYDLRYRKKIHVILVHNANTADALILCANENYIYSDITEDLPVLKKEKQYSGNHPVDLLICNLPVNYDPGKVKGRLKYLTDNCGGRVLNIIPDRGVATVRFTSVDFAIRAQRRIQGEDVFGNKVKVLNPSATRDSQLKNYTGRKVTYQEIRSPHVGNSSQLNADFGINDYKSSNGYGGNQYLLKDVWKSTPNIANKCDMISSQERPSVFRAIRGIDSNLSQSIDYNIPRRGSFSGRPRTPQDGAWSFPLQDHARLSSKSDADDGNKFGKSNRTNNSSYCNNENIELMISNLDVHLSNRELKRLLINILSEYVNILNLNITTHTDGLPVAIVKVGSRQEAQIIIRHLHHQKLVYRRMVISYAQSNSADLEQLRAMVISLLQEAPGTRMPLFRLISLLGMRYHCSASVSDIHKLEDVCKISCEQGGRIVLLMPEYRTSPALNINKTLLNFCVIHCSQNAENKGWAEAENREVICLNISLKVFSEKVHDLLTIHNESMPFLSFPVCYEMVYNEPLPFDDQGVPLEHLITCIKNVELKCVGPNKNVKYIKREINDVDSDEKQTFKNFPSPLQSNIKILCKELVYLLQIQDHCQLPLEQFISAYHHYFGRQCRVADYGYIKLLDLFESIPHVIQIFGENTKRILTLAHPAQIRRFTVDLLRILRSQIKKQITADEFLAAYEKIFNKPFKVFEYGLCNLEDLLDEVQENIFVYMKKDDKIVIGLSKREQTAVEMLRTKQFAIEVVNLLCHSPHYSMLFNQFVPAYHHHFGHQCKLSDYGFTKLIELFEAIPDFVKVEEAADGERWIRLTQIKALEVLKTHIQFLITNSKFLSLSVEALPSVYLREYGYQLKPKNYECDNILELLSKLDDVIQVVPSSAGPLLVLSDKNQQSNLAIRIWAVLLNPPHCMNLSVFLNEYKKLYFTEISLSTLKLNNDVVNVYNQDQDTLISLTHFYVFAAQLYKILYNAGGEISYDCVRNLYLKSCDKVLDLRNRNLHSVEGLVANFNFMVGIKKNKDRINLILHKQLAEYKIPLPMQLIKNSSVERASEKNDYSLEWPPPPLHHMFSSVGSALPPKPDTPPAFGISWNYCNSPPLFDLSMNLQIQLPTLTAPELFDNSDMVMSPTGYMLPSHLFSPSIPKIAAPDPTYLPLPDKLLASSNASGNSDDLNDSGIINNSKTSDNLPSDRELEHQFKK